MRDTKFRGKRLDTGEWVYGYYVAPNFIVRWGDAQFNYDLVDPETVGQLTGLLDKTGREIYEGDIVSCDQLQDLGFKVVGVVHYAVQMVGGNVPCPRMFLDTRPFEKHGSEFCIFHKNPEVIGTIHENPELLKPKGSEE